MEQLRHVTHTAEHGFTDLAGFFQCVSRTWIDLRSERDTNIHFHRSQRLPDLVVQLARQCAALLFLHGNQAGGQTFEVFSVALLDATLPLDLTLQSVHLPRRHDRDEDRQEQRTATHRKEPRSHLPV